MTAPTTQRLVTESAAAVRDTANRNRSNHTGQQSSSTISDLTEAVQDIVGATLAGVTGATVTYNDAANTITISGVGDPETMRDTIGAAMVGVGLISVVVNDGADTITISTTATANDTDANLKNRANHTGSQSISTVTSLQSSLDAKADTSHTHTATGISDSTSIGRSVLTAANLAAARSALGIVNAPIRFSAETPVTGTTGEDYAYASRTVTEARMRCGSAPAGSDLVAVVQHWNGSTWSTITTLTIAAGSTTEAVQSSLSQAQSAGHKLRLNVTSIGSGTAATDVVVDVLTV